MRAATNVTAVGSVMATREGNSSADAIVRGASDGSWPPTHCSVVAAWLTQGATAGRCHLRHGAREPGLRVGVGARVKEGVGGAVGVGWRRERREKGGKGRKMKDGLGFNPN